MTRRIVVDRFLAGLLLRRRMGWMLFLLSHVELRGLTKCCQIGQLLVLHLQMQEIDETQITPL